MHTFRSPSGVDFTGPTWPSITIPDPPQANDDIETTTWAYDPATGLLISKTDDSNKSVVYTYTPDGKLHTRTWARQVGANEDQNLITEYVYDGDTGEMTDIKYYRDTVSSPDPDTPWVSYLYDRLGRRTRTTQTLDSSQVGRRDFTYDPETLELLYETLVEIGDVAVNKYFHRSYDAQGRDAGFWISYSPYRPPTAVDHYVHYDYDSVGRLHSVSGYPLLSDQRVEYTYSTTTGLLEKTTYLDTEEVDLASASFGYTSLAQIEWVENKRELSPAVRYSRYEYGYDALARRKHVIHSGEAFAATHNFQWGYNTRSELITADRYTGETPGTPTAAPFAWDYAYDHIGNRKTYNVNDGQTPDEITYTANDLNQYTGTASPTEYFCHDDDGNLIRDGKSGSTCPGNDWRFKYLWDAENRLIAVEPRDPGANPVRVAFKYDELGRRVRKQVWSYSGGNWTETTDQLFLYDGWNVIAVLDANAGNAMVSRYIWGLDLSGSIHGAAGVGGLLACQTGGTDYWFFYDANGNVGQVIAADDLSIAAKYEYDPYGNVIASSGTYATANPIRFSTKWFDPETGLGNWGIRYYDPKHGRWISRDPMEAEGERNVYAFINNMTGLGVDPDGRFMWPPPVLAFDIVELYCYGAYGTNWYHCDIQCTSFTSRISWVGGGTGPGGISRAAMDDNPDNAPGWEIKGGLDPRSVPAGYTLAPPGTCDCITAKGEKLNEIENKNYDVDLVDVSPHAGDEGNTSNSNAAGSTLLACCGVDLNPTVPAGGDVLGWGHDVEYVCVRCSPYSSTLLFGIPPVLPIASPFSMCRVGCEDLE